MHQRWEFFLLKGIFWERLELQNFPVDVQELSVTLTSERGVNEVKLVGDPYRASFLNFNASNTFMEQQKWYCYQYI